MNRRSFLKNAGIMGAISAFPSIVPSICVSGCRHADAATVMAKRKYGPNDLINVGVIGQGRIAITMDMPLLINYTGKARIVAVCDLDPIRRANGKSFVEKKYNEKLKVNDYRVDAYENFEELLARKDIDAVMICLPDHWHAIVAVSAIIAGKDVWLQKPFSQTIGEGRIIANLAKKYHTVMQVGSWQRSNTQFHDVCELVRNGRIGKIAKVEVGIGLDKAGGSSTPSFIIEHVLASTAVPRADVDWFIAKMKSEWMPSSSVPVVVIDPVRFGFSRPRQLAVAPSTVISTSSPYGRLSPVASTPVRPYTVPGLADVAKNSRAVLL